jgi:hypothetical protein
MEDRGAQRPGYSNTWNFKAASLWSSISLQVMDVVNLIMSAGFIYAVMRRDRLFPFSLLLCFFYINSKEYHNPLYLVPAWLHFSTDSPHWSQWLKSSPQYPTSSLLMVSLQNSKAFGGVENWNADYSQVLSPSDVLKTFHFNWSIILELLLFWKKNKLWQFIVSIKFYFFSQVLEPSFHSARMLINSPTAASLLQLNRLDRYYVLLTFFQFSLPYHSTPIKSADHNFQEWFITLDSVPMAHFALHIGAFYIWWETEGSLRESSSAFMVITE